MNMRTISASLISLALVARAQAAQPSELLVVVDAAAPATELPAWNKVAARFSPGTPVPPVETLAPMLGKLIGAGPIAGVDWSRPLHAALVDPQGHPKPLVLVVPVKDAAALVASVKPAQLEAHVAGGWAVIGDAAILQRAEKTILAATRSSPAHGLRATAFVRAIDAAYGAQIAAIVQTLSTQTSQEMASAAKSAGLLVDVLKQAERLTVEVEAADATPVFTVVLNAQPGSPMAALFAAQKPSDFGLLAKLPATDAPVLAAGTVDLKSASGWFGDMMDGWWKAKSPLKPLIVESCRLFVGDLAMADGPTQTAWQASYLMRVSDVQRMLELMPKFSETAGTGSVMGMKFSTKALPKTHYAGLTVLQSEQRNDYAQAKWQHQGPGVKLLRTALTGWDDLMAISTGTDALAPLHRLVDSAHGGKGGLVLDAAAQASVDRARAAGDSFWARVDVDRAFPGGANQKGMVGVMTMGFQPTSMRVRFALDGK